MLVSQTSPVGVELLSYANAFFCSIHLHRCWPRERKNFILRRPPSYKCGDFYRPSRQSYLSFRCLRLFSLSCHKSIWPAIIFVFVWKIGVHSTIVRLGPLSTNVDLDRADDKYRIISSLLGLYKNNDRARSTRLPFLRRSKREGLGRFNRHLSIVLKPAFHYFCHWGGTEGNDLSDLLFHSLKIIPCSKRWKLFLPESLLYDVWMILD